MPLDPKKKKMFILLGSGLGLTVILSLIWYKTRAATTASVNPTSNGTQTQVLGTSGMTTAPHKLSCGNVSYTIGNTTVTGTLCTTIPRPPKATSGFQAHSDQNMYCAPYLKCVKFS